MALFSDITFIFVWTLMASASSFVAVNAEESQTVTFLSALNDTNISLTLYTEATNQNSSSPFQGKFSLHINDMDIVLHNVNLSEGGDYWCSKAEENNITVHLNVSAAQGDSAYQMKPGIIVLIVIIGLYITGVIIGIVWLKFRHNGDGNVFRSRLVDKFASVHDTVRFVCVLKEESAKVEWKHNQYQLQHDGWKYIMEEDDQTRVLNIRNVHRKDAGTYVVNVKPGKDEVVESSTAQLRIDREPWTVYLHKHPDGFGLGLEENAGVVRILNVTDGSPADRSLKLGVNDKIVKLNQHTRLEDMEKELRDSRYVELQVTDDSEDPEELIEPLGTQNETPVEHFSCCGKTVVIQGTEVIEIKT